MKIFVIPILCALVGQALGGFAGWPSAAAVRTIIPGVTKTTAYSSTQYINTLPASYSYGAQPQFAYQIPQVSSFAPLSSGYYASPSYIPATNFIYPAQASFVPALGPPSVTGGHILPAFPGAPLSPNPAPSNPALSLEIQPSPVGDSDSDVIESADFIGQQQNQQSLQPSFSTSSLPEQSSQPATQQFSPNNFSNFPTMSQIPQVPPFPSQLPQIPQFPQKPQQAPSDIPTNSQGSQLSSFPSIPQIPQIPQQSSSSSLNQAPQMTQSGQAPAQAPILPQYPPFPPQSNYPQNVFPQGPPQSQSTSFSGATNNDSSLNNDDTITVESA